MKKAWEHAVVVQAPVGEVYPLVADVSRHPEWDKFTRRVELSKPGDANGVGAEWQVYEHWGCSVLALRRAIHLTSAVLQNALSARPR